MADVLSNIQKLIRLCSLFAFNFLVFDNCNNAYFQCFKKLLGKRISSSNDGVGHSGNQSVLHVVSSTFYNLLFRHPHKGKLSFQPVRVGRGAHIPLETNGPDTILCCVGLATPPLPQDYSI